jgi:hypothetical protein
LPICLGCRFALLEQTNCQPVEGCGPEVQFRMPDGLFCTPPDDTGEVPEEIIVERTIFRPLLSRLPASCERCRRVFPLSSPPPIDNRPSGSRFHPVPTRPVFLPWPDRTPETDRSRAPMPGEPPPEIERLGTPEIELILPEPPPEEIPIPRPESTDERVTSTPSWIFRTSSRLKPLPVRESRLYPDSSGRSLRR